MKIFILILFISQFSQALVDKQTIIKNGVVTDVAVADTTTVGGASWLSAVAVNGVIVVDTQNQPGVGIGYTCVLCDGSDFQAPVGP